MKISRIYYHSKFKRRLKKIGPQIKETLWERIYIFRNNCFDARLRTHKLHGELDDFYSFSVTHSHRIIFNMPEEGIVEFIDIGNHSIYQ